jgi:hypothetical protein
MSSVSERAMSALKNLVDALPRCQHDDCNRPATSECGDKYEPYNSCAEHVSELSAYVGLRAWTASSLGWAPQLLAAIDLLNAGPNETATSNAVVDRTKRELRATLKAYLDANYDWNGNGVRYELKKLVYHAMVDVIGREETDAFWGAPPDEIWESDHIPLPEDE